MNNAGATKNHCVRNALLSPGQKLFPTKSCFPRRLGGHPSPRRQSQGAYHSALCWLAAIWWEVSNTSWEDAAMVSAHARPGALIALSSGETYFFIFLVNPVILPDITSKELSHIYFFSFYFLCSPPRVMVLQ